MILELGTASVETKAIFAFPQQVFDPTTQQQKPHNWVMDCDRSGDSRSCSAAAYCSHMSNHIAKE